MDLLRCNSIFIGLVLECPIQLSSAFSQFAEMQLVYSSNCLSTYKVHNEKEMQDWVIPDQPYVIVTVWHCHK